jgi:hypothetical protein
MDKTTTCYQILQRSENDYWRFMTLFGDLHNVAISGSSAIIGDSADSAVSAALGNGEEPQDGN